MDIENLRIAKDMKYEALYWALGFEEVKRGIFTKHYKNLIVKIDANKQTVDFGKRLSIINGTSLKLDTHKSFVILECIDKLLSMGYSITEMILDLNNEYDIYLKNLFIKCFEWGHEENDNVVLKKDSFKSITYSSRLTSGVIERRTIIKTFDGKTYNQGIFENERRKLDYELSNTEVIESDDFIIESGIAKKYIGCGKIVNVPFGVKELASCLFWDNQEITEVVLPSTLVNISGDTFYNCFNLEKVNIPINVKRMGNNPFAGCPKIHIVNESPYYKMSDGVLYNSDYSRLIYYPISKEEEKYKIDSRCKIIGKHSFYLCDNLKEVEIPSSIIKLENNPFSGCTKLKLINKSKYYHIDNSIIYDRDYLSVIGCLNSIDTDLLVLKKVKRICRNSFWNCKGIRKIVLPRSLEVIGYNPFVGCSNIEFVSRSKSYVVSNNALFNKDKSKLVCFPAKFAVGKVKLPEEVAILERGAFSGCDKMTSIDFSNVSVISKTCFTNCNMLEKVYCPDSVKYIGEWSFAHCNNLKNLSVSEDCFIDNNATLNSPTIVLRR